MVVVDRAGAGIRRHASRRDGLRDGVGEEGRGREALPPPHDDADSLVRSEWALDAHDAGREETTSRFPASDCAIRALVDNNSTGRMQAMRDPPFPAAS